MARQLSASPPLGTSGSSTTIVQTSGDRTSLVARNDIEQFRHTRRELLDPQVRSQEQGADVARAHRVLQVVVRARHYVELQLELVVERLRFLVDRLQFLLVDNIMTRFRRARRRSWDRGELPSYDEKELDTLAYLLISARGYVYSLHVGRSVDVSTAVRDAVQTH